MKSKFSDLLEERDAEWIAAMREVSPKFDKAWLGCTLNGRPKNAVVWFLAAIETELEAKQK